MKIGKGKILIGLLAAAVLVFGGLAALGLPVAVGAEKKVPIYCVDTPEKKIAISFDAAWGDDHTKPILDILDQYQVKTTFFLVDFWVEKFPDDVKEIARRGHEVGNHSATHPDMAGLSQDQIRKELTVTGDRIESLTGVKPTVFRPPFGSYSNQLIDVCAECGYQVIQWSVDSLDWKDISADQIIDRVVGGVEPGSIVLFHNNANYVEEYLPAILEKLQAEGYEIVPVGQLIYHENYHIDHTGKQIPDTGVR